MRVAYIGNFVPPHSTENHVADSFRALGHHVVEFQENAQPHRVSTLADRVLDVEPDLVLYTKTWGLPFEVVDQWRKIDAQGITTVGFHLDLYVGLDREVQIATEPFWRVAHVFTADGGHDDVFMRYGVDHEWLPAAVYKPEAVSGLPLQKYERIGVGFMGSVARYHSEWPYRQRLVRWLRTTYRGKFASWPLRQQIRGLDLNDLYASVPVWVGDSICLDPQRGGYWSDRVYETIGRGGFLIHPRIVGLDEHFTDGEHLRFYEYGNWSELRALIDYYLAHRDEARAIAVAGQEHVRAHHTYENRVLELVDMLDVKGAL